VVVYGFKWHCRHYSVVVVLLKMTLSNFKSAGKCVKDFVQIYLSRRGLTDLGQGGLPLLVVYGGRRMHYALLLAEVEVEGEWGTRDLLLLMLQGDRRHRRVHPRLRTRHNTSMSNIIRSRRMRRRRTRL